MRTRKMCVCARVPCSCNTCERFKGQHQQRQQQPPHTHNAMLQNASNQIRSKWKWNWNRNRIRRKQWGMFMFVRIYEMKKKWNWNRIAAAASSQPAIISLSSLNHAEVVFKVRIFSVFWFREALILAALQILSLGWWKSASPWIVTEINEEWNWNEKKSRKIRVCH